MTEPAINTSARVLDAVPLPDNLAVEVNHEFLGQMCAAIVWLQMQLANVESILVTHGLAHHSKVDDEGH